MGKPKGRRAGSSDAVAAKKDKATGWVASTFSKADLNKMRVAGLLAAATEVMMPGEEIVHRPQQGFQVMFTQFLFRDLSLSRSMNSFVDCSLFTVCSFTSSHQILFSTLRASVTLCDCFLGIDPHWGLWRRIFCIRRNVSRTAVHDVGGAIISTKGPTGCFDLRDHRILSSLPPLPEGGNLPEAAVVAESEAAGTNATPEVDDDDEEDAQSEASHTKASPPSATSHGEEEVRKKRKRAEIADDSESSGESNPAAFPSSSYADDPFAMAQILST
ncbi:hypothetical protein QYE76_019387 [Lolium multiflorum]|uniref:Uncharacterized protein n=1 Tax=Lolium multiflorum TaxID=4521 RepID=A0AAD8R5M5_LOLMU|nr:hypothetical protein QYE76_019386 [Lolium multiflorum]KAK1613870.1 hypothetical protein QYE76_019387 [Lolium multiflorum]